MRKKKLHRPHGRELSQIIDSYAVSVDDAKLSEEPTAESRAAGSTVGRFVPVVTEPAVSAVCVPPLSRIDADKENEVSNVTTKTCLCRQYKLISFFIFIFF